MIAHKLRNKKKSLYNASLFKITLFIDDPLLAHKNLNIAKFIKFYSFFILGIIAEIDTDGSGTVDFDEFMEMMTGD